MKTGTRTLSLMLIIFVTICTLSLSACGGHNKSTKETRQEVMRLAKKIDLAFVTTRKNTMIRKSIIERAYENMDKYDLSTEGMDVSEGGTYKWFEDYLYYSTKDMFNGKGMINLLSSEAGLYIDPELEYKPENASKARKIAKDGSELSEIKKEIRLWEHIIVKVMNAGKDPGYSEFVFFANPRLWLCIFSMYYDYASTINPRLTQEMLMGMEWLVNGAPFGNPEGVPKWTKDVFASLTGEGWVINISVPMYAHGRYTGLVNSNLYPMEIAKKEFRNHSEQLIFMSPSASLLGISKSAKKVLDVKELHDFDYVEQMKKNVFVQDEFKLTHESQKPYTQEIGRKTLAGKKEFDVKIKEKSYTVIVSDIPEVHFFVVGLVEK